MASLSTRRLVYNERGDPNKVIQLTTAELEIPTTSPRPLAVIKWLAASVNPADINMIQGSYAVQPPLPAVGGNEGCGVVERIIGGDSKDTSGHGLAVGQRVIPAISGLGTWSEYGVYPAEKLYPVDQRLRMEAVANFQVNPPTAYRMLRDFVDLDGVRKEKGETPVVLQNGANSAVGRYVIQIAKLLNYHTVNIVRDRPDIDALKAELMALGAGEVLTEEEYADRLKSDTPTKAHLALNCVGGRSALQLIKGLGERGCLVSYGAMSKQPLSIPTGPLLFNDLSLRGFWMSKWYEREGNPSAARDEMYRQLSNWFVDGSLQSPPTERRGLGEFREALEVATGDAKGSKKQLFVL
jgi:trans-2-enoyl-CoA reductase